MSEPSRGILDTSVFISQETGRELDEALLPDESAISVVTLGELNAGVLVARDTETRAARLATLDGLADVEVIPVDEQAALVWARMRVHLAESGRKMNVDDVWIAATAASRGLPVVTQDDDFAPLEGAAGLAVIGI